MSEPENGPSGVVAPASPSGEPTQGCGQNLRNILKKSSVQVRSTAWEHRLQIRSLNQLIFNCTSLDLPYVSPAGGFYSRNCEYRFNLLAEGEEGGKGCSARFRFKSKSTICLVIKYLQFKKYYLIKEYFIYVSVSFFSVSFLKVCLVYGGFILDVANIVKLIVMVALDGRTVLRKPTFVLEIIFTVLSLLLGGWEIYSLGKHEPSLTMEIVVAIFALLKFSLGELPCFPLSKVCILINCYCTPKKQVSTTSAKVKSASWRKATWRRVNRSRPLSWEWMSWRLHRGKQFRSQPANLKLNQRVDGTVVLQLSQPVDRKQSSKMVHLLLLSFFWEPKSCSKFYVLFVIFICTLSFT